MGRYGTPKQPGCSSSPDDQQSESSAVAELHNGHSTIPTQARDHREGHAHSCIVTGYSASQLLAGILDTDHELSASHTTQQPHSYVGAHDTPDSTPGGEDSLYDANINMESFKVVDPGSRNPTKDSGYGGSELKRTISTTAQLTIERHNDSGLQLAPSAGGLTQNPGGDRDKGDQSSLHTRDLVPVSSTTTLPPNSSANTEQFKLGAMTLRARKLLETDRCSQVDHDDQTFAYLRLKNLSSSVEDDLTSHQYRDPLYSRTLFVCPPKSLVVSGVHATLLASSENSTTYVHGSFFMPMPHERDPLYREPSFKYFQGIAGDFKLSYYTMHSGKDCTIT